MYLIYLLLFLEQMGCISATKLVWRQRWFSMAVRLVVHLQMVGHLICIAKAVYKICWRPKGRSSEPTPTSHPPYLCNELQLIVYHQILYHNWAYRPVYVSNTATEFIDGLTKKIFKKVWPRDGQLRTLLMSTGIGCSLGSGAVSRFWYGRSSY